MSARVVTPRKLEQIDEGLWSLSYPLTLLGVDVGRHVTIIRLRNGLLVLHSTGPFTPDDVAAIRALGPPGWIVETLLRHDTFSEKGHAAFPEVPFLAPPGFAEQVSFPTESILPIPRDWTGQLDALEMQGMPGARETVMLHRASRTLIVADLLLHFPHRGSWWQELMLKAGAVGPEHEAAIGRSFKFAIKDEAAFRRSLDTLMAWDFDRVIVGHGERIEHGGKHQLASALRTAGIVAADTQGR